MRNLLAFVFVFGAFACSDDTASVVDLGADMSVAQDLQKPVDQGQETCVAAGGTCVAVTPSACAQGTINASYFCGTGVGMTCCIPSNVDAGTD